MKIGFGLINHVRRSVLGEQARALEKIGAVQGVHLFINGTLLTSVSPAF